MPRSEIPFSRFRMRVFETIGAEWLALTAGTFTPRACNSMTVATAGLGVWFGKPVAWVFVRPQRYTYQFMERAGDFTLCAFPRRFRAALQLLGSRSGRDTDKVKEAGLTLIPSAKVEAPGFDEADLILECRKLYFQDLEPAHILDPGLAGKYPQRDFHRVYCGEVLAAFGAPAYSDNQETPP